MQNRLSIFRLGVGLVVLGAILPQGGAYADQKTIEGTVKVAPALAGKLGPIGTLFVFARPIGQAAGPPSAVLRVNSPKFPHAFRLGAEQAMIPGTEFKGPFRLTARFSPQGDAMQKEGAFEGKTDEKKPLSPGAKNVEILIDTPR
jgi:hypothetical protein